VSTLLEVEDGVSVWQPEDGLSNSAVLHAEGRAICVDLQARPGLARDLCTAIADELGHLESAVVTHVHADHILGASAFEGVSLVAQSWTAAAIEERGEDERELLIRAMPAHAEELAAATLPRPDVVVDGSRLFPLADRSVELLHVGPAHTPGDLVAFDRHRGVLIAGDVVVNGVFPVFRDASCAGWIAALERLRELDPTHVIPGHGPPASVGCIEDMLELLRSLEQAVRTAVRDGRPVAELGPEEMLCPRARTLDRLDRLGPAVRRLVDEVN
jgi:cyclase